MYIHWNGGLNKITDSENNWIDDDINIVPTSLLQWIKGKIIFYEVISYEVLQK